jgi:hypothetical protein
MRQNKTPNAIRTTQYDYMTIQFNCPHCDALIAFDRKHCGKRARCQTCGQLLIIPSEDYEKPKKVELKVEKGEPLPGFYRAVFVDSWKLFTKLENVTGLVFIATAVCFKFILGTGICCVNYISFIVVWGWLLGFYLNIIYETAYEIDKLPQVYLGTCITFLWYIIKPLFIILWTMALVETPLVIAVGLLQGPAVDNLWKIGYGPQLILQAIFIFGLFLFPMAILTVAVGKDIMLLRPDYVFKPIFRKPVPYMAAVLLLIAAGITEMQTRPFTGANLVIDVVYLFLDLTVQVITIVAMRAIGLFYRHYSCHFAW